MSKTIYSFSILLDYGTNNRAEYLALIQLLEMAIKKGIKRMNIYGDSKLAVMQVNHKWKANKDMAPLRDQVLKLLNNFDHWSLSHILRDLNAEADLLTR
jgi:ribonuclease HI